MVSKRLIVTRSACDMIYVCAWSIDKDVVPEMSERSPCMLANCGGRGAQRHHSGNFVLPIDYVETHFETGSGRFHPPLPVQRET